MPTIQFALLFRLFGFVARKQGSTTDNASHLFAELDPDQPASAIVSFVSKTMNRWKSPTEVAVWQSSLTSVSISFLRDLIVSWFLVVFFFCSSSRLVSPSVFPLCLAWFVFFGIRRLRCGSRLELEDVWCGAVTTTEALAGSWFIDTRSEAKFKRGTCMDSHVLMLFFPLILINLPKVAAIQVQEWCSF